MNPQNLVASCIELTDIRSNVFEHFGNIRVPKSRYVSISQVELCVYDTSRHANLNIMSVQCYEKLHTYDFQGKCWKYNRRSM